jgi:phage major head subunit gpT-like protein
MTTFPKHLEVAARTGVLAAQAVDNMPYRRVAMEVDLTAASTTFVDLGGLPIPTNDPKAVDVLVEKGKTVEPKDWYLTVQITQNEIDDDQTGTLESKFMGVLAAFQRHINDLVFTVLNAGDGGTYGTGITSEAYFFDTAHLYVGGKNATSQSNLNTLALSDDNFDTAHVAMSLFKDDQENYYNLNPNLLICNTASRKIAYNITKNSQMSDTANRELNPYYGLDFLAVPQFDSTAWVLIDESYPVKPLFVAIRKRPTLNESWFDPQTEKGGTFYWQYHGRYVVGYGDPLLAYMGKT